MAKSKLVVLDASVVAKLLIKESDSPKATILFESLTRQRTTIIEPHFLKSGIYSLIRKKITQKEINPPQGRQILTLFNQIAFDYLVENDQFFDDSFNLAQKLGQTVVYDCLYLTLAQLEKAEFITADLKFLKQAKKIYPQSFSLPSYLDFRGFL